MLEVNAIYFILLLEGFAVLALALILWLAIAIYRMRRKGRAVRELAQRIEKRAAERVAQNEAFLQAVYGLENEDLQKTVIGMAQREDEFFELLLDAISRGKSAQIGSLDSALERLVDGYKCLQPRSGESSLDEGEMVEELGNLRGENEQLRCELSLANNKMSALIEEFGSMFGGGKDHELALEEIKEKVAALDADQQVDFKLLG